MPFKPGNKLGKGRPVGAKNKRRSVEEVCLDLGLDPFKEMGRIAADVSDPNHFQALKELAQYLEPKRKAVEVSGNMDLRLQRELESLMGLSEEELLEIIKREIKA